MKIHNRNVGSTPIVDFNITGKKYGGAWFRLYWTEKSGINGYQVVYHGMTHEGQEFSGATDGGGFCKESQAFQDCLKEIFGFYKSSVGGTPSYYLHKYQRGNSFEMNGTTLKNLYKKAFKRSK